MIPNLFNEYKTFFSIINFFFLFTLQQIVNALNGLSVRSYVVDKAPTASRNFIYNCRWTLDSLSNITYSALGGRSV
jgi:hypothetical protein